MVFQVTLLTWLAVQTPPKYEVWLIANFQWRQLYSDLINTYIVHNLLTIGYRYCKHHVYALLENTANHARKRTT